jgi:hypothetical protein
MNLTRAVMMLVLAMVLSAWGCGEFEESNMDELKVRRTLDRLHAAASRADGKVYFEQFAPDAVFLGTDASERWTLAQFKAYAEPYFAKGQGWTYTVTERTITREGSVAWFDERLSNEKYGECRGTGVLVRRGGEWKIAQYNLTVPIPNDLLPTVAQQIRAMQAPATPQNAPQRTPQSTPNEPEVGTTAEPGSR